MGWDVTAAAYHLTGSKGLRETPIHCYGGATAYFINHSNISTHGVCSTVALLLIEQLDHWHPGCSRRCTESPDKASLMLYCIHQITSDSYQAAPAAIDS